ncbi:MAG TPA: DsrE family protein [Nitrososphaeraceae archaeon]|nr:DsrE family protein [Nitrososphaeraceae archaeon]
MNEGQRNNVVVITTQIVGALFLLFGFLHFSYAQTVANTTAITVNANPLVYHLSSSDPWRASIAVSDATAMKNLGHNVTLLLSIEGVQVGVQNPHHHLGLNDLVQNVTDFLNDGGKVVVCKVCLEIAGYDVIDTINGTIIATPEITSKVLSNATVIDY